MNCLVTGASGFLGRQLCTALRDCGHTVVAGLRTETDGPWERVALFDLASGTIPRSVLQGVSCVFHLAGKAHAVSESSQNVQEYMTINTAGTRRLLEASREAGVTRIVYFSSVKAMGEDAVQTQDERTECHPTTPYGISKREAERLVLNGDYLAEAVVLRLSMVYGPTFKGNVPRMIEAVNRGHFPPFPEVGNRRTMVHVDDVIQAALLAMKSAQAAGQTYIVTDGKYYSTRQMYLDICMALGRRPPGWIVPVSLLKLAAGVGDIVGKVRGKRFMFDSRAMQQLTGSACYSSKKIERELGFQPRYDFSASLPEIVAYLRHRGRLD